MTHLDRIPPGAAVVIAVLVAVGSILALLGAIGLVRFGSFYERLHAPTLGTSWGAAAILIASMVMFSVLGHTLVIHELFIGLMMLVTLPVPLMMLGRAALNRDRAEGRPPAGSEAPGEP